MYVYILKSESFDNTYYTGLTKDLKSRLQKHNGGDVSHTKQFAPWKFKNAIWFDCEPKARAFERYLKSSSGRAFAKKHL